MTVQGIAYSTPLIASVPLNVSVLLASTLMVPLSVKLVPVTVTLSRVSVLPASTMTLPPLS